MVSRIAQLKEMGFSEEVAKRVLAECVWDVNTAIDRLLASGSMPGETAPSSPAKGPKPASPARPGWGPAEATPSQIGTPAPAAAIAPPSAAGRAWPQPTAAPEPRGCWGAGAPGTSSPSSATKAEGAPCAAEPLASSGPNPSALEPPAVGPPPNPAVVVAAEPAPPEERVEAAQGPAVSTAAEAAPAEEPPEVTVQEPAVPEEPVPASAEPHAAESVTPPSAEAAALGESTEQRPQQQATVVPEGETVPEGIVAQGEGETSAEVVAGGADGTVGASGGAAPPRKHIQRVERAWVTEDSSQMSVSEGDFVDVWVDTKTQHGWIHAEKPGTEIQVGWLPACVLQQLPENQRWMRARQAWQALDESQCSVEEGAAVIVWINSRTAEGWTYVESQKDGAVHPGWLPAFCLEWSEA